MKSIRDTLIEAKVIFEMVVLAIKLFTKVFGVDFDTSSLDNIPLDALDDLLKTDSTDKASA